MILYWSLAVVIILGGCAVKSGTFECSCDCNNTFFECSETEGFKIEGLSYGKK